MSIHSINSYLKFFPRLIISRLVDYRLCFEPKYNGRVVIGRDVNGIHHVVFAGKNAVGQGTIFSGNNIEIGYATTIGPYNYLHGPLSIGNYCQFGPHSAVYAQDHPSSFATTYINSHLFEGRLKKHVIINKVSIGHGVWVGHGAIILKGVTIGNGAIIGAGAVVTKDVQPYSIIVGNPGNMLRKRYPEEIITLMEKMRWWELSSDKLLSLEALFHVDLVSDADRGICLIKQALEKNEQ